MMRSKLTTLGAAALGAMLLGGVATLALADEEQGSNDVDILVDVAELPSGALALSIGGDSTTLTEGVTDNTSRIFTGSLPTVTVSDTRDAADIPDGAFWYVVGSVSQFSSGANTIPAENLGWAPALIDGGELGLVAEGDVVDPALDGGPGLVDQELLAMASDSAEVHEEGAWTATADLTLKTAMTVEPGMYSARLTLSLFE